MRKSIESILREIENTLNTKMEEFNDTLFPVKKKPPYVHFNAYNSYRFETPDNTGTGSNYKGMIVYDLAVLFTTALPAIAHDSLLFSDLSKDAVDGIIKIYTSTKKQILHMTSREIVDLIQRKHWRRDVFCGFQMRTVNYMVGLGTQRSNSI